VYRELPEPKETKDLWPEHPVKPWLLRETGNNVHGRISMMGETMG